ncbi:MAG: ABC transporter permease [Eubacterium sp.]|nr:ABC transporter permease [Eubacterium sp.]
MLGQLKMITGRNLKLYLRDKGAVFFSLLSMLIVIVLMTLFLGDIQAEEITSLLGQFPGRDAAADEKHADLLVFVWTCAGILSINAVTVTLSALSSMVKDKASGKLNALYTAPVSRLVIASGYVLAAWAASVVICMLTLLLTEAYGVVRGLEWFSAVVHLKLVGMIAVNSFAYAAFMYVAAVLIKSEGSWSGLGTVVGTLTGFLGGIYLPIGQLSEGVGNLMKCTPIIYGTALFREVMTKPALDAAFADIPAEVLHTYREMMGIDLVVFGKTVTAQMSLALLLIFGAVFLMIGVVAVTYGKRADR